MLLSMTDTRAQAQIVDGPIIVVGAHDEILGGTHINGFTSFSYAQQLARRHSSGYNEAWVCVAYSSGVTTQWLRQSYFYNGKRERGWPPPEGCTWKGLIQREEQEQDQKPTAMAAHAR